MLHTGSANAGPFSLPAMRNHRRKGGPMEPEKNTFQIPVITHESLTIILERMSDVMGMIPKRKLFSRTVYTLKHGGRTETITLSRKALTAKITYRGHTTGKAKVTFPFKGYGYATVYPKLSVINIRESNGILVPILLSYTTKATLKYILFGEHEEEAVTEPTTVVIETPEAEVEVSIEMEEKEPYVFPEGYISPIVRNANVPPIESFKDLKVPYPLRTKPTEKKTPTAPSTPKIRYTDPNERRNPFYRRNRPIIERARNQKVEVYTDGGLRPEEKKLGGWAYAVIHQNDVAAMEAGTEVNSSVIRMELMAATKALHALEQILPFEAVIYVDNRYVVNGAEIWWKGWLDENGHIKKEMDNADLWGDLVRTRKRLEHRKCTITFQWIKGHAGNKWNEYVDQKNKEAMDKR